MKHLNTGNRISNSVFHASLPSSCPDRSFLSIVVPIDIRSVTTPSVANGETFNHEVSRRDCSSLLSRMSVGQDTATIESNGTQGKCDAPRA